MPRTPTRSRRPLLAIATAAVLLAGATGEAIACDPDRVVDGLATATFAAAATTATPATATSAGSAIVPGTVNRSTMSMRATYAVDASLRLAARVLSGTVRITATNLAGKAVDRVRLNTTMGPLGRLSLGAVTVDG